MYINIYLFLGKPSRHLPPKDHLPTRTSAAVSETSTVNMSSEASTSGDSSGSSQTGSGSVKKRSVSASDVRGEKYPAFTGESGPSVTLSSSASPLKFFKLVWPTALIVLLVQQTNLYAQQNRVDAWEDVTVREMGAFLGMVIAMSLHRLPAINDYWSTEWILSTPYLAEVFPRRRFWQLWSNIHLADNSKMPPRSSPTFDKLYKLRPLLDILKASYYDNYHPSQELSVDESMIRFKGRSSLKQYMPLKPIKRGIKVWCCSCACCGYLCIFQIYTGAGDTPERGLAQRVVKDLVFPHYGGMGHVVYADNYFTSLQLCRELLKGQTYLTGTIRPTSKGFPEELQNNAVLKKSLAKHEYRSVERDGVTFYAWKDTKIVRFITNVFSDSPSRVSRRQKDGSLKYISCPSLLPAYNKFMGGVDLCDLFKATYGIDRKSKRWWLRIFFSFLDFSIVNSFILYRHACRRDHTQAMKLKTWRVELAKGLIDTFTCRKKRGRPTISPVTPNLHDHKCTDLRKSGIKIGECEHCSKGQKRRRKRTVYGCGTCGLHLCPVDCFDAYHAKRRAMCTMDDRSVPV